MKCVHTERRNVTMMKKNGDCLKFDYRIEVDEIQKALETFAKEHPADASETVKETINLLDAMYIAW